MSVDLITSLHRHFGFSEFRPGQAEAIQHLLDGQNVLVVMPTGSGKSLIYQLASLHLPGLTLVLSPLIALMKDQVDSLAQREIPATFINSSLPPEELDQRLGRLARGEYRLVYIAPERLRKATFLKAFERQAISLLVVDEAHCISEWGHDFRPDYLHIASARRKLGAPLTAALTATATPRVQDDILHSLEMEPSSTTKRIITGFNRPNLNFSVRSTNKPETKYRVLADLLVGKGSEPAIIYTGTRREAEEVAEFVREVVGAQADHYHAGLPTEERSRIQEAFMSKDLHIVAATNAFGMGIDRSDVRMVIHFNLPSTLEAYYQEAGRAGRDGQPAKVVLLYDPKDRSLQEWFIENSVISYHEIRQLYDVVGSPDGRDVLITSDGLSLRTSLPETKIRVGLSQLERAGIIERYDDDGLRMVIHRSAWKEETVRKVLESARLLQEHKWVQLNQMIHYAESNGCRRAILLAHFGDRAPAGVPDCCDNCLAKRATPAKKPLTQTSPEIAAGGDYGTLSRSQRAALILLDAVKRQKQEIGREKLALILQGSRAKEITRFHYDQNLYYGKLQALPKTEILRMIDQLVQQDYLKLVGGKYPVLRLTPKGEAALQEKSPIPIQLSPKYSQAQGTRPKKTSTGVNTLELTAQLFKDGLDLLQIAQQRGLAASTIYQHLAQLIARGEIPVEAVIPQELRKQIEMAIVEVGHFEPLYDLKIRLPDEIDYNTIRCVVEAWKQSHPTTSLQDANHSAIGSDISKQVKNTPKSKDPVMSRSDAIASFLSHSHPRPLLGPWQAGWALDFHSRFSGDEWERNPTGELAYRLKYQQDLAALQPLVRQAMDLFAAHPEMCQVDAVLPVPPSTPRLVDPVTAFAKMLASKMGLPLLNVLGKTRQTEPQKSFHTLAQKRANVAGAFKTLAPVQGKRLLVVDDLFDSGATLEEITRLLFGAGASQVCVLTLTRTIHSDV